MNINRFILICFLSIAVAGCQRSVAEINRRPSRAKRTPPARRAVTGHKHVRKRADSRPAGRPAPKPQPTFSASVDKALSHLTTMRRLHRAGEPSTKPLARSLSSIPRFVRDWKACVSDPLSVNELKMSATIGRSKDEPSAVRLLLDGLLKNHEPSTLTTARVSLLVAFCDEPSSNEAKSGVTPIVSRRTVELHRRLRSLVREDRVELNAACKLANRLSPPCMPVLLAGLESDIPVAAEYFQRRFEEWSRLRCGVLPQGLTITQKQQVFDKAIASGWINRRDINQERDARFAELLESAHVTGRSRLATGITGEANLATRELAMLTDAAWLKSARSRLARPGRFARP